MDGAEQEGRTGWLLSHAICELGRLWLGDSAAGVELKSGAVVSRANASMSKGAGTVARSSELGVGV